MTGGSPVGQAAMPAVEPSQCDLVMKGGITSGVIYPKLVSQLASRYRFKNIGGTSAGAIAAGACAAAEYGRGHGNPGAFDALELLPAILGAVTPPSGRSKLFTLFQPTPALREHFGVLVGALNAKPADAARRVVLALLKMHPLTLLVGLVLGSLLLWPFVQALAPGLPLATACGVAALALLVTALGVFLCVRTAGRSLLSFVAIVAGTTGVVALLLRFALSVDWSWSLAGIALAMEVVALLVLAVLLVVVVGRFGATLLQGLHRNGYGVCSGRTADSAAGAPPGLTDWLTGYLNDLAGLPRGHRPLTFGDLWGTNDADAPRQVNLEVMTSAISQQMVYGIPFRKGTPRFHYDPDEWGRLFPPEVMRWLDTAAANTPEGDGSDPLPDGARVTNRAGTALRPLPRRADMPVVVAVRMSLSFPILLSAVPLYSIDWSRKANQDKKKLLADAAKQGAPTSADIVATRVWFSDGGIGSNMPLHMFDALLPGHPTFAVNLKAEHPDFPIQQPERPDNDGGRIYLPDSNVGGRLRYWPAPADGQPLGGLVGFLLSIVDTMQNWRDEILFPYPGFRDRIVQISQRTTEGGLNLDMPATSITALANAGEMTAGRLIDRFHSQGAELGRGWTNHQTVRLGTFLGTMQPGSAALQPSLASGVWAARVSDIKRYRAADRQLAFDFLHGLEGLGALGTASGLSLETGALKPLAEIRVTPRI